MIELCCEYLSVYKTHSQLLTPQLSYLKGFAKWLSVFFTKQKFVGLNSVAVI